MKIVHIYAKNIKMFVDAVEDTDCRLNASTDLNYLISSLQRYNVRDVLGLIIFSNPMTKKCLKLMHAFDDLFVFKRLPIIIISDDADELKEAGYFKVNNSDLYTVNSEDNSISDIDINNIFTTLIASSDEVYDLSAIPAEKKLRDYARTHGEKTERQMSQQLVELLKYLGRSEIDEHNSSGQQREFSENYSGPSAEDLAKFSERGVQTQ